MKLVYLWLIVILAIPGNAQIEDKSVDLYKIEHSTNFNQNIAFLENELKTTHTKGEELLKIQVLLISNYINSFQFDKASAFCQKEILTAQNNNWPFNEATLYRYLGNVYYYLKQKDKAFYYWNQCLDIAEKNQFYNLLKKCNHNIGVIALETEQNPKKAERYFLKAIEYGQKTPSSREENLANNYRLLATTYDLMGKYTKADSLFLITTDIYKKYQDSAGLSEVLTFHSRLFISMKKYDKALSMINESINIAKLLKLDDYLQTALSIKQKLSIDMGNYKEAYLACNEILTIEIAKQSKNQKKEIADSEAKFKVEQLKNKQELAELQAKQTKRNYVFISLFLFLISIASIVMIYQKRLAKKEQALKLKNLSDVYDAEEKERIRIAKDLHDNMGAYATSILAQIDMLELTSQQPDDERLKDLRNDAEFIMSTLRETIWILKTKNITTIQFFDLLKIYTGKHLVKNLGIKVNYNEEHVSDKLFSPTVSLNLYRIVQEIIQNIIKHAQAKTVTFKLTSNYKACIEIQDDGIGFDITSLKRKSGLDNMQFRAKEINFNIIISSEINKGTRIVLEEIL